MEKSSIDYNLWHAGHEKEDDISAPWHEFVKKNLLEEDFKETTILEIGCGRGGFSNYLARLEPKPKKIYACDYSETAVEIAKNKYNSQTITWEQQDIMNMSYGGAAFNAAISCETIEHIPNPALAIKELHRVLKPRGKLLLTCPNYFNLFGVWCLYRWLIGKPYTEGGQPYVNYILFPHVYLMIRRAGFKIEKLSTSELILPARIPKTYFMNKIPWLLKPFGYRTFYVLRK